MGPGLSTVARMVRGCAIVTEPSPSRRPSDACTVLRLVEWSVRWRAEALGGRHGLTLRASEVRSRQVCQHLRTYVSMTSVRGVNASPAT